jgi:nucleoside-diphosphate kinase
MRTLAIIKPDATKRNITGKINALIEDAGFKIIGQKRIAMSKADAQRFYAVHSARSFFGELIDMMSAGPVVVQVLEKDNAVSTFRELMGATNPTEAKDGTIRKTCALSIGENSIHGSDSEENAKNEIAFFFSEREIIS